MGKGKRIREERFRMYYEPNALDKSKKIIYKKYIFLWYFLSYLGLAIFLGGFLVLGLLDKIQSLSMKIIFVLGITLLFSGQFMLCAKCKCPYCNFGSSGSRFSEGEYQALLTFRNAKKGMIVCPRCRNIIEIK